MFSNLENKKGEDSSNANLTSLDLRIYDLDKDLKKLNEDFEELVFEIDDLKILNQEILLKLEALLINNKNSSNIGERNNLMENENNQEKININENNTLGELKINSEDMSELKAEEEIDQNIELTPEEEFQSAFNLIRSQQFDDAKAALKIFISKDIKNNLSGSAHYWLGEIHILQKEYREAALILAEGYQKYPKSIKAPDMLYKLSVSLSNINKGSDACNTLVKFTKDYPNNNLIEKVQNKILELKCVN